MLKKIFLAAVIVSLVPVLSGCFWLAVGAGAGGTALWQGGKVVSEEAASMATAVSAVETTFKAKKVTLKDKVIKNEVTQLRGEDSLGTKVAVDVFSLGSKNARVEIRYGLGEETPAREFLNALKTRL